MNFSRNVLHVSLAVVAAAMVFSADVLRSERACLLDPAITGRICSAAVCVALQDQVNALCKPKPARCREGEGCFNLRQKKQKFLSCYEARSRINVTCWGGGDLGHQGEAAEMIQRVSECSAIIALPEPRGCADPCPFFFDGLRLDQRPPEDAPQDGASSADVEGNNDTSAGEAKARPKGSR